MKKARCACPLAMGASSWIGFAPSPYHRREGFPYPPNGGSPAWIARRRLEVSVEGVDPGGRGGPGAHAPLGRLPFHAERATVGIRRPCASVRLGGVRSTADQVPRLDFALSLDRDQTSSLALELVGEELVRRPGDLNPPRRPVRFHPARG